MTTPPNDPTAVSTPRTDAQPTGSGGDARIFELIKADFARLIERELVHAEQKAERLVKENTAKDATIAALRAALESLEVFEPHSVHASVWIYPGHALYIADSQVIDNAIAASAERKDGP